MFDDEVEVIQRKGREELQEKGNEKEKEKRKPVHSTVLIYNDSVVDPKHVCLD